MRLKIIAGALAAVLLVGLGSYFYVRSELEQGLSSQLDSQIEGNSELFARSWRLAGLEFLRLVEDRAKTQGVEAAYRALDQNSRRTRAHEQANTIAAWFQDPARGQVGRPDLVALLDETGSVIARDQDINRMAGNSLNQAIPVVRAAIEGQSGHDVWWKSDENKVIRVAVAPVHNESGGVIGALLVGYDVSNGFVQREAEVIGRDVVIMRGSAVYSSSLEPGELNPFEAFVNNSLGSQAEQSAAGGAATAFEAELGEHTYVGLVRALPETPSEALSFAVLGDRAEHAELTSIATVILFLTIAAALLALAYGFLVGGSFMRPLTEIEEGILTVINGRTDHRLNIESAEFGGLAYRINQLINVFTGVQETDESGRNSTPGIGWSETMSEPEETAGASASPEVAALADEPESSYQSRIFQEYVDAKRAAGEDVSNIPQDRFLARLSKNAEALKAKHGCRMVRFHVETKGSQVILRPVIIR